MGFRAGFEEVEGFMNSVHLHRTFTCWGGLWIFNSLYRQYPGIGTCGVHRHLLDSGFQSFTAVASELKYTSKCTLT